MKYTKPEINVTYLNNEDSLMVSGVINLQSNNFKKAGVDTDPKYSTINFS